MGWVAVWRRRKTGQKRTMGKNRGMSQSEELFRKNGKWEDEKGLGIEESGGMTQRTQRDKSDWQRRMMVTCEVEEWKRCEEEPRKERDDWTKMGLEGETWGQRRGSLRGRERRVRSLDFGRRKGGKDGFQGEGRGES
jgi:hypothetical protein